MDKPWTSQMPLLLWPSGQRQWPLGYTGPSLLLSSCDCSGWRVSFQHQPLLLLHSPTWFCLSHGPILPMLPGSPAHPLVCLKTLLDKNSLSMDWALVLNVPVDASFLYALLPIKLLLVTWLLKYHPSDCHYLLILPPNSTSCGPSLYTFYISFHTYLISSVFSLHFTPQTYIRLRVILQTLKHPSTPGPLHILFHLPRPLFPRHLCSLCFLSLSRPLLKCHPIREDFDQPM